MSERPNIILITTDQQRFDTISALGNRHIFTPHLNWLADGGISYSRAYTDCPICVPARATIMNGRHAFNHGLMNNTDPVKAIDPQASLAGLLTKAGYQTRAAGKMHFVPNRCNYGFEHIEILDDYYRHMARFPHLGVPMDHGLGQNEMEPGISTVEESASLTHWVAQRSIDFLETRDEGRPFFLWTGFSKPHPPFDPCMNYWQLYHGADMPDPVEGDWSQNIEMIPQAFCEPTYSLNNIQRFGPEQIRNVRRAYYACITQIDYNLGLLFARMREMGLLRNTWIIFTSDHGEMLGDHHLGAKTIFFEGSSHIPLLIRPPGEWDAEPRRGSRCDGIVCLADVLPTCLSIAGADRQAGAPCDGLNLLDAAEGKARREILHGQCLDYHMVLDERFKYVFASRGAAEMMFNLREDPYEQHELIRAGENKDALAKFRGLLIDRLARQKNPAVKDGRLVSIGEPKTPRQVRATSWPGFHSTKNPNEVAH